MCMSWIWEIMSFFSDVSYNETLVRVKFEITMQTALYNECPWLGRDSVYGII